MQDYIRHRVVLAGNFIVENKATIRSTAFALGLSKSTVHNYLSNYLSKVDLALYEKVRIILDINKAERARRGGLASVRKVKTKNWKRG